MIQVKKFLKKRSKSKQGLDVVNTDTETLNSKNNEVTSKELKERIVQLKK